MHDGDFFVPVVRLDLLQKHNLPLPNTWKEVVEYAKFFHGTDLNDDGEPDYGFCHFPRVGAGNWDWWFSEAVYSTWAPYEQTDGITQGFFFDEKTTKPRLGAGFRETVEIWKDLWTNGNSSSSYIEGRCAIGFGPPGEWKGLFLDPDGISRKDANGTVVWQATMKNGDYAEPYRFRGPFGSLDVADRTTGELVPCCTPELCPKAEVISGGHHGENDRTIGVLPLPPS
jgi:ABC-type glycerol-3-phosphate transport system substrate-binding protein